MSLFYSQKCHVRHEVLYMMNSYCPNLHNISLFSKPGGRMKHINPFRLNSFCQCGSSIKQNTFLYLVALLEFNVHLILLIITLLSLSFFFFSTGLSICSFHLPQLSPRPLIYTVPSAPMGQTRLRRHSL